MKGNKMDKNKVMEKNQEMHHAVNGADGVKQIGCVS